MAYTTSDLAALGNLIGVLQQLRGLIVQLQGRDTPAGLNFAALLANVDAIVAALTAHAKANL